MVDQLSEVRVLAVDDHEEWRSRVVQQLLRGAIQVVGLASDGVEAIEQTRILRPNVILMDVSMPRLNGLLATRAICDIDPAVKILITTNINDPDMVEAAFHAGARGYMLKASAAGELLDAIDTIVRGELFIGRGVAAPGV